MRKIIGAALIVLSLAGCSPGNLAGDSDWSRGYFKVADKEQRRELIHRRLGCAASPYLFGASRSASSRTSSAPA